MNTGKTIFSQIMEFLPQYEFRKCVARYQGDYKVCIRPTNTGAPLSGSRNFWLFELLNR